MTRDTASVRTRARLLGPHLLWALIPTGAVALLSGWAVSTQSWADLGVQTMTPNFADLRQATYTAQCASLPTWTMTSPGCDPFGRPYNLPSFWAKGLALLGVTADSTEALGVAFVVIFVLSIAAVSVIALTGRRPAAIVTLLTLAAISPPVNLLLERGNVDVIVFLVVVLSIALYFLRIRIAGAVGIAIAALLKLFPLGAAIVLLVDRPRRRVVLIAFAALAVIDAILLAPELALISSRTQYGTSPSFGIAVLPMVWFPPAPGPQPDLGQARLLGYSLFAVGLIAAVCALVLVGGPLRRAWSRLSTAIERDRTASILVLSGGGSFIIAYLAGTSWDYRLVFLIPLVAGLARIGWATSRVAIPLAAFVLLQFFLSYPVGQWQFSSDFAWLLLAPAITVLLGRIAVGLWRAPALTVRREGPSTLAPRVPEETPPAGARG